MKIERVEIRDFRSIKHQEIQFTDELARIQEMFLLAGPNGSGKTTILDAIAACLRPIMELSFVRPDPPLFVKMPDPLRINGPASVRPDLHLTPQTIVRRGAIRATVTCTLRFDLEEIEAVRQAMRVSGQDWQVPDAERVVVEWEYPDMQGEFPQGRHRFSPIDAWLFLKGRALTTLFLHVPEVDFSWFERVGGVFTFDQQRTGMGKTIPREIWEIIGPPGREGNTEERYTTDPRTMLLSLAVRSQIPKEKAPQTDYYPLLCKRYATVCHPHRIVGPIDDGTGRLDMVFSDGECDYRYDGLSSGEQMVLLFLLRFVSEHIHKSIVLIDEVELHQHPLWQRKLLNMLPKMGRDNQFILTTHSAYVRDIMPQDRRKVLGELGEQVQQEGIADA